MKDARWPELTTRQADFVREFLVNGGNAAEAAREAGYSARTARSIGQENLTKPDVMARLATEREKAARSADMTVEEVAMRLSWLARTDPDDFFHVDEGGVTIKDTSQLSKAQRFALREAAQTKTETGGSIKIKLDNPKPALDTLATWLGMLTKKLEVSGPAGGPIPVGDVDLSKLTPEQLRSLVEIRKALETEDDD